MSLLGIDIGNNNCKVAVREGAKIRLISKRMPDNMVRGGEMASPAAMAKFLRSVRSEEHVRERNCALVLGASQVFFRNVTLPAMTTAELKLNLPYEFRDFISGDPDEYVFDYAVDEIVRNEEGEIERMQLFAAAVSKPLVMQYGATLKKAGFKLKTVMPAPMAYSRLLRSYSESKGLNINSDVVLVDLGHDDVTVSLFHGLRYDSARTIDFGCDEFDHIIAELKGIDPYTASAYKFTNFENVLDDPACAGLYARFALEVSKVVNFYNFNNPEREISHLFFLGGGASIPQLTLAIAEAVSIPAHTIEALLPQEAKGQPNALVCALALGAMLEGEAM